MGDLSALDAEEKYSEEKTEPFSLSEIESRLQSSSVRNVDHPASNSVPLDDLVVPPDRDIRLLVRPLARNRSVSPGTLDNCEWLALRAEIADQDQPQHKVLAVTQTSRDIKFVVRVPAERMEGDLPQPPLWCELYYDPASDNQILLSRSDVPISLSRVSNDPVASPAMEYLINPDNAKALIPGTWRIRVHGLDVLDFRILEKRPAMLRLPSPSSASSGGATLSEMVNSSGKRSFADIDDDEDDKKEVLRRVRKSRATDAGNKDDGVIMFLQPEAKPLVLPLPTADKGKEVVPAKGHPLLDLQNGQSADIPGEVDQYSITRQETIASTGLSTVFKASHSDIPDDVITVKVLKTRLPAPPNGAPARPQAKEGHLVRQAEMWLREVQFHGNLIHDRIVKFYGGDARYLSLYMENIPAENLASKEKWLAPGTQMFRGYPEDAERILEIAGALNYLHGQRLVHNDIKPANILYSRERGAVLCDFGLSATAGSKSNGGTPYYVPPEFIGHGLRGTASDVWALGITMLYVLRKISLPEARAKPHCHPVRLFWLIADLNRPPAHHFGAGRAGPGTPSAVSQMQQWLAEISVARSRLDPRNQLECLVADMLATQPSQRITMETVSKQLRPR